MGPTKKKIADLITNRLYYQVCKNLRAHTSLGTGSEDPRSSISPIWLMTWGANLSPLQIAACRVCSGSSLRQCSKMIHFVEIQVRDIDDIQLRNFAGVAILAPFEHRFQPLKSFLKMNLALSSNSLELLSN